ncbi:hypothetical protein MCAP1_003024 [Malassezia caprae]|uniref:Nucleoporin protein Ndc1-Nup n=1 Tax=Malassezia caprae TaxID=1381934 RepID=A0AAF0J188_9BASI|nr:hypothetical protein MCAP1_003024 [Malassezia caprae]
MDARLRAPPPGSPAATYRALVKEAMRPRQKRIYVLAWIITYAALAATQAPTAPLRSFVVLGSAALLASAVVALLLFRRTRLISAVPARTPQCVSRAALVAHLVRADDAWHAVALHAASGAFVALQCAVLQVCLRGWSAPLAPMRYIDAHHAYYVNEAFLGVLAVGTTVGAVYAVAYLLLVPGARRGVPPFVPAALGTSLRTRCLAALQRHVPRALGLLVAVPLLVLAYSLVRDAWWSAALRVVGVETSVRRFLVPSFRVPYAPGTLCLHALRVTACLLVLFEATHTLFDVYWTHPLRAVPPRLHDPLTALLGGLHDPHPFFSAHALAELAHWAQSEPARRHALFEDVQQQHGRPMAFSSVATACRRALDALAPPEPAPKAAPPPAPAPQGPPPSTSVWHRLAAPPEARAAPAKPAASAPAAPPRASALWRTLLYLASSLWARLPSEAQHVLFPQTLYSAFFAPVPALWLDAHLLDDRARACWAAQALQHLVLASLAEDKYGSVQPHVPALVPTLAQAHERLMAVRRRAEAMAVEADTHLVREAQLVRGALAAAGADANAATFPPSLAPFQHEMQHAWEAYACVDYEVSTALRGIVQAMAPYHT